MNNLDKFWKNIKVAYFVRKIGDLFEVRSQNYEQHREDEYTIQAKTTMIDNAIRKAKDLTYSNDNGEYIHMVDIEEYGYKDPSIYLKEL